MVRFPKDWLSLQCSNGHTGAEAPKKDLAVFGAFCRLLWAVGVDQHEQKRAESGFFMFKMVMNKQTRKELAEIVSELETLRDRIEALKDEEQEKFDSLNEGLQQTERGQELENAASALEDAESDIDSTIDNLNEII